MWRLVAIVVALVLLGGGTLALLHGSAEPSSEELQARPEDEPETGADLTAEVLARPDVEPGDEGGDAAREATWSGRLAPIALSGRLVDESARPVAGAVVEIFVQPDQGPKPTLTTRTDGEGRYRFAVAANRSGRVRVAEARWALRDGDAPYSGSAADVDLGDLVVQPAAVIAGHVRDLRQKPVAGADLSVASQVRPMWLQVKSGADGSFEVVGLGPGQHQIHVQADGLLSAQLQIELAKGQRKDGVVLLCEDGVTVFGVAVDDRGKPVEGATIACHSNTQKPPPRWASSRVKTDAEGRFRLPVLPSSTANLEAAKDGHRGVNRGDVAPGTQVRLELARLGRLHGRLTDEMGNGIAASSVAVAAGRPGTLRPRMPRTTTKEDGSFELAGVTPGTVHLVAEGEHLLVEHLDVTVRPGEATEGIEIRAKRGGMVVVRVVGPDGAGVPGATVELSAPATSRDRGMPTEARFDFGGLESYVEFHDAPDGFPIGRRRNVRQAKTDEKGVARLGAAPGRYEVSARHDELIAPEPRSVEVPATGATDVTIELRLGGFVLVQTNDAAGQPLGRQGVRAQMATGKASRRATTDAAGKIRLGPLEPGAWHAFLLNKTGRREHPWAGLQLEGGGGRLLETSRVEFRVESGQQAEVTLVPPPLAIVSGSLRSQLGPLPQAQLRWRRKLTKPDGKVDWQQTDVTRTDRDGGFHLANVEPGSYRVEIDLSGMLRRAEMVEVPGPGQHRREILLDGRDVVVRVLAEGSEAGVAGAQVTLRDRSAGTETSLPTDAEGKARFKLLPAAAFEVAARHERHLPGSASVSAQAGDVTVRLPQAASIEVRVVSGGGGPVEQWDYRLRRLGQPGWDRQGGGQKSVSGLLPGKAVEIQARRREDRRLGEAAWGPLVRVELRAGESVPVRLTTGR